MSRYFIEVAYDGTNYSGFQVQKNSNTIQAEVEVAFQKYYRQSFALTGSSRTDGGVHALQNYFHVDADFDLDNEESIYHLNAILPADIVIKSIQKVNAESHCRFDALSREYRYYIYTTKNPFKRDNAFFYPYPLDMQLLEEAATIILSNTNFQSFAKKNSQVHTYNCKIFESNWLVENQMLIYRVIGNRFLRGMVKGLVGTMLQVGAGKKSIADFNDIINAGDNQLADFSVPSRGLFLEQVRYPYID